MLRSIGKFLKSEINLYLSCYVFANGQVENNVFVSYKIIE